LYIFSFATAQAALLGYFFRFVSPNWPAFSGLAVYFFSSLAGVAALEFAKGFLNLKEQAPRFYKGAVAFQIGYILAFFVKLAGFYTTANLMLDGLGGLVSIYAVVFSSYLTAKGSRPARFFLIAWVLFLFSIILFVLKNLGFIPQNNFTQYLLQIGSGLEAILLSLALADKINTLTYENQLSQARALDMARENERIVKEQNTYLERKVQERTLELQEANVELRATLDHLKETQGQLVEAEKMASLGQLTAGIAHEINNPINFVTSNVSPLKRDFDDLIEIVEAYEKALADDDPKAAYAQVQELREELDYHFLTDEIQSLINGIKDGANRTAEIVRGLRTFSRLDEDDVKMADIHEGIDSTLTLLNNKIRDKIEVVKDYHSLPEISCYPGKLNQLFMNILSNAIQAIEMRMLKLYDETPGKIAIQTRQHGKNMVLTIADNGIGMNDDVRKRIFEPFFTTKEVGEGTGLGLSIVFKIIEKHQGNISVSSEPGKGTTFTITLPLQQPNNTVS
jgi:signal transduction histidine kinase